MDTSEKHRVKVYLYDNVLTDTPNDYMARVSAERTLSITDICRSAQTRGGADVSARAMQHSVELFLKEMAYQLCDGYGVNTGYFTATTQVKGVFHSPAETFDPGKHAVSFLFNQGELMRQMLPNVKVEIMGVADTGCQILQVTDVKTGSVNEVMTPNGNIKIRGSKIKIDGNAPSIGLYFIHQQTNTVTRLDASDVVVNNPSELIVLVPSLVAGTYQLEVRTQYSRGGALKEPKVAVFDRLLTVG